LNNALLLQISDLAYVVNQENIPAAGQVNWLANPQFFKLLIIFARVSLFL